MGKESAAEKTLATTGKDPILFGDQKVESGHDFNGAGLAEAFPFGDPTSGTVSSISVYVDASNAAARLVAGIYSNGGQRPGTLITAGSLASPKAGTWNTVTVSSAAVGSGKTYWVAVLGKGGTLYFRDRSSGPCASQNSLQTNLTSLPSSWTPGRDWSTCPISAFVNGYLTTPPPITPVNTVAPVISGATQQGQTLTSSNGSWTGSPTSYGYQWQDCSSSGRNCTNSAGSTSGSYTLTSGDIGHTVAVVVTATNAGGSASSSAASTVVRPFPALAASFTFSPSVPVTRSSVQFNSTGSTCGAAPCSYSWADNPTSGGSWPLGTGPTMSFTFANVGTKYVTLTVTDAQNRTASVEHDVAVSADPPSAPVNNAAPTIAGTAQQGQTLTTSNGTWTNSPASYSDAWEDCNSTGTNCSVIQSATSSSYTLQATDVGSTLRSLVTATNAGRSATAQSSASAAVTTPTAPSAPTNTAAPSVSGTAAQNDPLTTSNGTWTGSPTSYAYQWKDCDGSDSNCANIAGATSNSYTLASGDIGHTIRSTVTATNASGSTPATSAQTSAASGSGARCNGAANTPGGPDPWGGCFPGAANTGVPAGTNLVTVETNGQKPPIAGLPADNTGWTYVSADSAIYIQSAGAVVDGVKSNGVEDNVTGASYTLTNSEIDGVITSAGTTNGNALIENSTINGGSQSSYPTVGIPNVDVESSNLYGGKDEVNCEGDNCTVTNSWLHDDYTGNPASHQQGFFSNGTSNDTLTHNSILCTGGCTADISVLNGGAVNGFSASSNLLVASPDSSFCVYPGPDSSTYYNPISNVNWSDNVFQRGSGRQCGFHGPVYGWYPSMCTPTSSCTWTGNMWDNGAALDESNQ